MISGTFSRRDVSVSSGRRARGEPARRSRSLGVYTPGRLCSDESDCVDRVGDGDRDDSVLLAELGVRL